MWVHWLALTVAFAGLVYIFEFYLDVRQSQYVRSMMQLPRRLQKQKRIDELTWAQLRAYLLLHINFHRVETTVGYILESAALMTGFLGWLFRVAELVASYIVVGHAPIIRGIVFIFLVSFVSMLLKLPFELYRLLELDGSFSGNRSKMLREWVAEQSVIFVISVLAGVPLISLVLVMISASMPFQWFLIWVFVGTISAVLSDVYPYFIGLFFAEYVLLPDGQLREAIEEAAERVDYQSVEIYTVDGSRSNGDTNAIVVGLSDTKRVYLYDTMLRLLNVDEMTAVIMHEFGHRKLNRTFTDSTKQFGLQFISVGVFLYAFSQILDSTDFFASFGFAQPEPAVALVLFSYWYGSLAHVLSLVTNYVSHRFEYAADKYALERGQVGLDDALIKMHTQSLSNIACDPLYSLYHNAHPSLVERLDAIEKVQRLLRARPAKHRRTRSMDQAHASISQMGSPVTSDNPAAAAAAAALLMGTPRTMHAYRELLRQSSVAGPAQSATFRINDNPVSVPVHIRPASAVTPAPAAPADS